MTTDSVSIARALEEAVRALGAAGIEHGDPTDSAALLRLLQGLYAVGRRDLPLGRLLEGHVDAVQIVHRLASTAQRIALDDLLRRGAMLGVWNADLPGSPLTLTDDRLTGGKAYASGAGVLTHALVTAATPAGPQLLLLDLATVTPDIDRTWWRVAGMQRSETHLVSWSNRAVQSASRIGGPDCYAREPWFSGGVLRFVAVHAGGIAALLDHAKEHLLATGRAADPHQTARLATLYSLAQAAADTVRGVAGRWFAEPDERRLPQVAAARLIVADGADRAISIAREAVGLAGMFISHPLATTMNDLAVYLRQPAPDAQRMRVGHAVTAVALDAYL